MRLEGVEAGGQERERTETRIGAPGGEGAHLVPSDTASGAAAQVAQEWLIELRDDFERIEEVERRQEMLVVHGGLAQTEVGVSTLRSLAMALERMTRT